MDDEFLKDAELARRVVSEGLKVLKEEGGQFAESIGKLSVLSAQEARDFRKFQNQIEEYFEYVKLKNPSAPSAWECSVLQEAASLLLSSRCWANARFA